VYRTSVGVGSAAVKLIPIDESLGDVPLVEHANIIRLFDSGVCEVGQSSFRYFLTELADEDLASVIAQRALSPEELGEMLVPYWRRWPICTTAAWRTERSPRETSSPSAIPSS